MKTQVIFSIYNCTYQILAGWLRFPLEGKIGDLHVAQEMITNYGALTICQPHLRQFKT